MKTYLDSAGEKAISAHADFEKALSGTLDEGETVIVRERGGKVWDSAIDDLRRHGIGLTPEPQPEPDPYIMHDDDEQSFDSLIDFAPLERAAAADRRRKNIIAALGFVRRAFYVGIAVGIVVCAFRAGQEDAMRTYLGDQHIEQKLDALDKYMKAQHHE